jgi:hypothetical protein
MEPDRPKSLKITRADVQGCELERLYPGILRHFEKAGLVEVVEKR